MFISIFQDILGNGILLMIYLLGLYIDFVRFFISYHLDFPKLIVILESTLSSFLAIPLLHLPNANPSLF